MPLMTWHMTSLPPQCTMNTSINKATLANQLCRHSTQTQTISSVMEATSYELWLVSKINAQMHYHADLQLMTSAFSAITRLFTTWLRTVWKLITLLFSLVIYTLWRAHHNYGNSSFDRYVLQSEHLSPWRHPVLHGTGSSFRIYERSQTANQVNTHLKNCSDKVQCRT